MADNGRASGTSSGDGSADRDDITRMLRAMSDGDAGATDRLFELLYEQLRAVARRMMAGERAGHTLSATAVVNEAWLRLAHTDGLTFKDRQHFHRTAARAMRRVLFDHANARNTEKRGGKWRRVELALGLVGDGGDADRIDVLMLDELLEELAGIDAVAAEYVELRYFGNLSAGRIAEIFQVSPRNVQLKVSTARAHLQARFREMSAGGGAPQVA